MAPCRQATGTYCTDVTQTKYADAHRIYLSLTRLCSTSHYMAGIKCVQQL